ncbi:penicillin-binding transpeptidase domain-containing protein [Marichromatium gracile]|uniref:Peptidoglycan glycosyltransferase n=1 Tax=Marichromatium gracile TaxID=1048 RepID=A0ABR5VIH3_MARGR|nr:penicillin-binding transpeptidase domain-containing protein [Marichromatium gracile]KXX65520.1 peptidoglycan glycosyltransferase [Marichromatium gracile]
MALESLTDPTRWPVVRVALHAGLLLALAYLLQRIRDLHPQLPMRQLARGKGGERRALLLLILLFAVVLLHQASWQLTGMLRPQFMAFMQLYDRRDFNPAHRLRRGRILDRNGEVLVYSEEQADRVRRHYRDGPVFGHVVGYRHPRFGATGLEAVASVHLDGGTPLRLTDWGRVGRQVLTQDEHPRGHDLWLTLDAELQRHAVALLGARRGAVVMLRPQDGALLVLASTPGFDPERIEATLGGTEDAAAPLLNRATQGLYPPGSTFKVVMAALALEHGFNTTIDCPPEGFTTSARYPRIRDHEYYEAREHGTQWRGHGAIGLGTALARSSNVFFAKLGVGYGHAAFYALADRLHANRPIVLHHSAHGRYTMQTLRLPRLDPDDRYGLAQMSLGQGALLTSPAQLALIGAAMGNQGVAMRPRLLRDQPPEALGQFFSPTTSAALLPLLRAVVTEGTARAIDDPALRIAGKTGTAQHAQGRAHSWFLALAPAERPTLAVAVLVERGGYGAVAAAPIARALIEQAARRGLLQ